MGMGGNGNGNGFMGMGGNGNRNSPSRTPLVRMITDGTYKETPSTMRFIELADAYRQEELSEIKQNKNFELL